MHCSRPTLGIAFAETTGMSIRTIRSRSVLLMIYVLSQALAIVPANGSETGRANETIVAEGAELTPASNTWKPTQLTANLFELRGAVISEDSAEVWFQYGETEQMHHESTRRWVFPQGKSILISDTIELLQGESLFVQFHAIGKTPLPASYNSCRIRTPQPPVATTFAATGQGETKSGFAAGMTLNGRILPGDLPTSYYFQYSSDQSFGMSTATSLVGPERTARYSEQFDLDAGGFLMIPNQPAYFTPQDGVSGGCIAPVTYPEFLDPNHQSGTGFLYLTIFNYSWFANPAYGNHAIGGDYPDLRDAKMELSVRTKDFKANGARLHLWAQSQLEESYNNWHRSNWVQTAESLLPDSLIDNTWQQISFSIANNANNWSYAGNDMSQTRAARYQYWPLDSVLSTRMLDFIFALTPIDSANPPHGTIAFDDFQMTYRNHSLLSSGNGGRLTVWPDGSFADPYVLTDGDRNAENAWGITHPIDSSVTVEYTIDPQSSFDLVQIAQHPIWPAAAVTIALSQDGIVFDSIGALQLPQPDGGSPNQLIGRFELPSERSGKAIRFVIHPVAGSQLTGLSEIELFGSVAQPNPGSDTATVNTDISGLTPGAMYYYRLVAVNDSGISYGAADSFIAPAAFLPRTILAEELVLDQVTVRLSASVQGMGDTLTAWFEYGIDSTFGSTTESLTFIPNQYSHALLCSLLVDSLQAGQKYFYRSVVSTTAGTVRSPAYEFVLPTNNPPALVSEPSTELLAGSHFYFQMQIVDPDAAAFGDTARCTVLRLPNWMTYDTSLGIISGHAPFAGGCDDNRIEFELSDNKGSSLLHSYAITLIDSVQPVSPAAGATMSALLPAEPIQFSWNRPIAANGPLQIEYELHLRGDLIDTIVTGLTDTTHAMLPYQLPVPDQQFDWWVTVAGDNGCAVQSPVQLFQTPPVFHYRMEVDSQSITFPSLALGSSDSKQVQLSNYDSVSIPFTLSGLDTALFVLQPAQQTSLPAFSQMQIELQISPNHYGTIADTLIIQGADRLMTILISGNSPPPALENTVDIIQFGDVESGKAGVILSSVRNSSINTARVDSISGLQGGPFLLTLAVGSLIDSASGKEFACIFNAIGDTVLADTARIFYSGLPDPLQLILTGHSTTEAVTHTRKSELLPSSFALHQNYPNPFNPSTTISFDLPVTSHVTLTIYNALGQEVTQLLATELAAGSHIAEWSSTGASGIYLAKIDARPFGTAQPPFSAIKKMLLVK